MNGTAQAALSDNTSDMSLRVSIRFRIHVQHFFCLSICANDNPWTPCLVLFYAALSSTSMQSGHWQYRHAELVRRAIMQAKMAKNTHIENANEIKKQSVSTSAGGDIYIYISKALHHFTGKNHKWSKTHKPNWADYGVTGGAQSWRKQSTSRGSICTRRVLQRWTPRKPSARFESCNRSSAAVSLKQPSHSLLSPCLYMGMVHKIKTRIVPSKLEMPWDILRMPMQIDGEGTLARFFAGLRILS